MARWRSQSVGAACRSFPILPRASRLVHMTRRTFIQALGALTAASSAAPQGLIPKGPIAVGVLGASHSHASDKIRLLQGRADFSLVGVSEPSEAVRARYGASMRWLSEAEVLERSAVVFVESEVLDHARHALAALRAGKHVHVEKPPSTRWEEMRAMIELARAGRLLLQSGYMWRTHPGFAAIFEAVRQGWLGEVYQVRAMMNNQLASDRRGEWAEFAGGAFFEQASHLVDALVRLLGRPLEVSPFLRSRAGDALKDNNVAVFEFPKALAVITNATHQPNASAHRGFEVFGTNGTMVLRPIEPPQLELDLARPAGHYKAGRQRIPLPRYERYVGDIEELARALKGEAPLTASLDEELLVHEWVLRASGMWE